MCWVIRYHRRLRFFSKIAEALLFTSCKCLIIISNHQRSCSFSASLDKSKACCIVSGDEQGQEGHCMEIKASSDILVSLFLEA